MSTAPVRSLIVVRPDTPARSDSELLSAIATGDLEALGSLFDRHEPGLRRYFGRMGATAHDADDLVQQTFLEVERTALRFDTELSARAWIYGVATMMMRRHRRSLSRIAANLRTWASLRPAATAPPPDASSELDETTKRIGAALERMSPKKREVFVLVAFEGLSGDEVAKLMGIPLNTVWTRLHHARQELRAALEEVGS
ncbi:MAG TPA: RNA polymerase sigma factor [Labilithrix sp.]|jgi:RNA polymerase sigma-70 factor (ECF subfamily)|nr:RNA polymerase sigma factor [Labilithrix sp.]